MSKVKIENFVVVKHKKARLLISMSIAEIFVDE